MTDQATNCLRLDAKGLLAADGQRLSHFIVPPRGSAEWQGKQQSALPYYEAEAEIPDAAAVRIYRVFEQFVARALFGRRNLRVLDVGCGISKRYPIYAELFRDPPATSDHIYVGLDPFPTNFEREYPFICGRLEDFALASSIRFNVFMYATSLDHFENVQAIASATKALAAPGSIGLFWTGLHDRETIAESAMLQWTQSIFGQPIGLRFLIELAKTCLIRLPQLGRVLAQRDRKLNSGILLDDLHFNNFRSTNIGSALSEFGRIEEELILMGGNHFARVSIGA